ncbi:hypothetical protein Xcel_0900 [Xylanimonas cellulosilytica DSM 15894]|uniref:Uncharacterized protein n=1 Tax=Xylanimonas cellulosilytica (strain DSM 15894 / JCM 12276 / CECT 5975 / KCTC 9989 / LMG 20990 / NBRC 107835 / XIL07) TaxID=446471 RepID=D1BY89_XYLCX|nr:hypothetical protein Xcel_0900 [Xylanimonas cellulosilytica DSM 15894]
MLGAGAFGLFAEMLLVGLAVSVLSLAAVTALPAVAAGVAHVRRHLHGRPDGVADLGRDFLAALRGGWVSWVAAVVVLVVLAFNVAAGASGAVPGGTGVVVVTCAVTAVVVVALLRAAARWTPGARWRGLLSAGARAAYDDVAGSALLLLAVGLSCLVVWMFAPLVVLVPGLLCFATVAVEARAR